MEDILRHFEIAVVALTAWCRTTTEVTDVPACVEAVEWGVPLAFKTLVASDRNWVNQFCAGWGACTA